ncbi:MAG: M48 family metalloprotease [Sphingosinicella sp.]|nr:M48 family metalloprotease [Sphingosinicella sp.]
MKIKAIIALSASVAAIGCASGGLQGTGANRTIAPGVAQQASQQHPQIIAEFGGALDGNRNAYVSTVGRKVGAQSGIRSAYTFTALNSPVMNAFAVPGGYVYVTRQLMGLMNDEAELASVLGHEAGHIAADHSAGRQNRGLLSQILAAGAAIVTGSSQLGQIVGQVAQLNQLSYSRNQEFEADTLGIRYMTGAGYDPNAATSLLASLGAATALEARAAGRNDERSAPAWAQTHPLSADRVARAAKQAQATGMAGRGIRNRDQYLAMLDGVIVDDDPRQGVVEGRSFRHPDLRLQFTVPQGYGIQNGVRAVSITGSNGQAQFSGGSFNGNLGTYIGQVFQALGGQQTNIQYAQPRSTNVNGIPAAYSTARVATQQGQVDVTVFAYQWDSNTAYHFVTMTRAGAGNPFESMFGSLGRLTAAQAAAIRPRIIDVVTVRAGDTVQSLANRMAYNDMKTERFLTLNGLQSNSRLSPGQKVKVVVYGTRT